MATTSPTFTAQNRRLAILMLVLQAFQLFALPLLVLPRHPMSGLLILLLLLPSGNLLWALIHQGIHNKLHPDRWSRILSIAFGNAFDIVKFGHLMHHRYNRDWESEYYDPRAKSYLRAAFEHYGKLVGGIYLVSLSVSLLFMLLPKRVLRYLMTLDERRALLPGLKKISDRYFFERGRVAVIRKDTALIVLLYGASFVTYGSHWGLFLLMVLGRAFVVSFMDNIYHYATPPDNSVPAKEIALPKLAAMLFLNGNLHQSHHRHADAGWEELPQLSRSESIAYTQSFWAAARDQWRGPIALNP